ncbi:hypothetical protein AAE478_005171 [Parahypoxylon ruwenzoriense]
MSTGGTGGNAVPGLNYGAKAARRNVDLADDPDPKGTAAGYTGHSEDKHRSLLDSLKDALKPGDVRRAGHAGDSTQDGRRGGVEETMEREHRDYDEQQEEGRWSRRSSVLSDDLSRSTTGAGASVLESAMPGKKEHIDKERGRHGGWGITKMLKKAAGRSDDPRVGGAEGTGGGSGAMGKTEENKKKEENATERASAFDSQGSAGHEFLPESAIEGTAHRLGGPFAGEGPWGGSLRTRGR